MMLSLLLSSRSGAEYSPTGCKEYPEDPLDRRIFEDIIGETCENEADPKCAQDEKDNVGEFLGLIPQRPGFFEKQEGKCTEICEVGDEPDDTALHEKLDEVIMRFVGAECGVREFYCDERERIETVAKNRFVFRESFLDREFPHYLAPGNGTTGVTPKHRIDAFLERNDKDIEQHWEYDEWQEECAKPCQCKQEKKEKEDHPRNTSIRNKEHREEKPAQKKKKERLKG